MIGKYKKENQVIAKKNSTDVKFEKVAKGQLVCQLSLKLTAKRTNV